MASREDVFEKLLEILEELFEIEPESVTMESEFYEDLEIDSIDAVDMMVRLREVSGRRVDPEEFKNIRTVGQCVKAVQKLYDSAED